jgi:hypothetical protein
LIKPILEDDVRLELDGVGFVDFPPEELVALHAGGVAGLGEAVGHASNLSLLILKKRASMSS